MNIICVLTDMGEEDMYENQGHYTGEGYPDQLDEILFPDRKR
jgi:hypothetical protein